jgi:hypothetical protein
METYNSLRQSSAFHWERVDSTVERFGLSGERSDICLDSGNGGLNTRYDQGYKDEERGGEFHIEGFLRGDSE